MQTLAILLPYLRLAAGAGAGWLASILFDWLRTRYAARKGTGGWLDSALYSPRLARFTVWGLTALIAIPAAVLAALIEGQDAAFAADAAVASLVGAVAGQVRHAWSLPPATDTTVVRVPDVVAPAQPMEVLP